MFFMTKQHNYQIIFVDYTWCKSETDQMSVLRDYKERVLSAKTAKVHVVVDFTGQFASNAFIFEAVSIFNQIKIKIERFAIIGITGVQGSAVKAVMRVTKSKMYLFDNVKDGYDFVKKPSD